MGEIRIPVPGDGDSYWPDYMAKLLREVVQSWVTLVETGGAAHYVRVGEGQPTTEHLRVAKAFLAGVPSSERR